MKNIAIVVPTIRSGGAEKQAALLAKNLSKRYQLLFIVFYGNIASSKTNASILEHNGLLRVYYLKGSFIRRTQELFKILKRNRIDVVFNYLTMIDVFGALIERMAGVNTIYNGIRNSRLPKGKIIFERLIHNHVVTGTVFNCYSGAEYFKKKGFKSKGCFVIQNCFKDISEPINRVDSSTKTIITIGRFVAQKDYNTSLKAILKLKQKGLPFHYNIIGFGDLENSIRTWIVEYGLQNDVTVFINPSNTQELLKKADIYLSTSIFEGTSNSVMEAMNWSIPVVATNVGDNEYLIKNNYSGFLCSIGDVEGLANALASLIKNHDLRNEMGKNGNNLLKEKFSETIFEQRYLQLLETGYV